MAADRTSTDQALIARWEQLRTSPRLKGGFLLAVVALIVAPLAAVPTPEFSADRGRGAMGVRSPDAFDPGGSPETPGRGCGPHRNRRGNVLDVRRALCALAQALRPMLRALARAKPRAIALDTVLPERSYDFILKGSDIALMQGLALLKNAQVPLRLRPDAHRQRRCPPRSSRTSSTILRRKISAWISRWLTRTGPPAASSTLRSTRRASPLPTLASQVLRQLRIPVREGYIDYSIGAPLEYVPMQCGREDDRRAAAQDLRQSHRPCRKRHRRHGPLEAAHAAHGARSRFRRR